MKAKDIKTYYRLNLPHIQPIGLIFFVTFRLKDSIPKERLFKMQLEFEERLQILKKEKSKFRNKWIYEERQRHFLKYDQILDVIQSGPHYLKDIEIANVVAKELHRFDGELYNLLAYCIMSNHVHILIDTSIQIPENLTIDKFETLEFEPLQNIMKRIKGPTAVYANRLLNRKGKFWQRESYDHYIRDEKDLNNTIAYILDNPVTAGLVKDWREYPFTYLKFMDDI